MHLPQVNINGTDRSHLLELLIDAKRSLARAVDTLNAAAPHPRDYQYGNAVEANRIFYEAQREHAARIMKVRQVLAEIETIAEHVV